MRETIFPPAPTTFDESPKSRLYDPKAVDAAAPAPQHYIPSLRPKEHFLKIAPVVGFQQRQSFIGRTL